MLYRQAHALLDLEGHDRDDDTVGTAFRVRPADGDTPDHAHRFVLWSTLTTLGPSQGEPAAATSAPVRPPVDRRAELVFEVSEDGKLWVPLDPHVSTETARAVKVPFLLPYVRARVHSGGLLYAARAVLLSTAPFTLAPVVVPGILVTGVRV